MVGWCDPWGHLMTHVKLLLAKTFKHCATSPPTRYIKILVSICQTPLAISFSPGCCCTAVWPSHSQPGVTTSGWATCSPYVHLSCNRYNMIQQGLVHVPFWEYWTSPEKVAIIDHIPNGWVMWKMGTWLMTHDTTFQANNKIHVKSLQSTCPKIAPFPRLVFQFQWTGRCQSAAWRSLWYKGCSRKKGWQRMTKVWSYLIIRSYSQFMEDHGTSWNPPKMRLFESCSPSHLGCPGEKSFRRYWPGPMLPPLGITGSHLIPLHATGQ